MPSNEQIIRNFYEVAEKDVPGLASLFTDDGYFYDVSGGAKYYGEDITAATLGIAAAFPDIHREIHELYVSGDVVSVELSLNGTHNGSLQLPTGTIPATGKKMRIPCSDIFHLKDGKVQSFHCYSTVTVMLGQLGPEPTLSPLRAISGQVRAVMRVAMSNSKRP